MLHYQLFADVAELVAEFYWQFLVVKVVPEEF